MRKKVFAFLLIIIAGAMAFAQKYDGPALAFSMPIETKEVWLSWMRNNRNDAPAFLEQRWKLAQDFVRSSELKRTEDLRAFLLTPREHFVRAQNEKGLSSRPLRQNERSSTYSYAPHLNCRRR